MGLGAFWKEKLDDQDGPLRLDRFDATAERIPLKILRFFGPLHPQMGSNVDFAPGAICILLCCN